ncbi:MAG: phage holin family protein [Oscillospiraceae bacterium]|nr:phage holin family protein [Oscillospiraceae bacterium]
MEKIAEWVAENTLIVVGAVFAFAVSLLTRRQSSWLDRLTEAVLCSLLSTGIFYGLVSVFPHIPQEAAVAVGSFVGFYGVSETKRLILDNLRTILSGKKGSDDDTAN